MVSPYALYNIETHVLIFLVTQQSYIKIFVCHTIPDLFIDKLKHAGIYQNIDFNFFLGGIATVEVSKTIKKDCFEGFSSFFI